jgi:hypothetical protein
VEILVENGNGKHRAVTLCEAVRTGRHRPSNAGRKRQYCAIRKYLAQKGIPEDEQPEIKHILVVLMKNTVIGELNEAPIPVVNLEDLKRVVRREDREACEKPLAEEQVARLTSVLDEYSKKNS